MSALSRSAAGVAGPAPVGIVHLGLGAFFRAHQAAYTEAANTEAAGIGAAGIGAANTGAGGGPGGERTGIAAFTGRRPDAALPLAAQDGLYHLLVRDAGGDRTELVTSISGAYDGADVATWCRHLADPGLSCVTLTVTEAGYRRGADGGPDLDDPDTRADLDLLRRGEPATATTAPGRLLQGLAARRAADAGPLAIVPCDNLVDNGTAVQTVVTRLAIEVDPGLADWVAASVSFVSTTIDRITPATTPDDVEVVAKLTGYADAAPVVTEPFSEWVLAGDFPAGRPAWELAGARFVADVRPFEDRKLWLLNGAHSLLAYAAPSRGHATVAAAIDDPVCRSWVETWWDEAARHLRLPADDIARYRADLLERFANPRIRHALSQIAMDGSQKLPIRVLPVLTRERESGVLPEAGVLALAGWLAHLREGTSVRDARADYLRGLVAGDLPNATARMLHFLSPALADDAELLDAVTAAARELGS